jgi:hypothetical protein
VDEIDALIADGAVGEPMEEIIPHDEQLTG